MKTKARTKIIAFSLVSLLMLGAAEPAFGAQTIWTDVSGRTARNGLISPKRGNETNIVVSETGKIFAAFQDKRERIFVMEFSQGKWLNLPDGKNSGFIARNGRNPFLASGGNDIYASYTDLDKGKRARVRKWNGSEWSDLADASHPEGCISQLQGFEPVLAFDKSGENLYAAFRDELDGERIKVMKWRDDSGWSDVSDQENPDGLVSPAVASEADLKAAKSDNGIFAAFEDRNNGNRIRVRKWDGSRWQDLFDENHAGGVVSTGEGYSPSIDTDSLGNLFVVYTGAKDKNTYIHKWNGSKWEEIGGGLAVSGKTKESVIFIDGRDYVYLAYSQKVSNAWRVRVKIWDGIQWREALDKNKKNISRGRGKGDPSLAAFGNRLYMSFTDARNKNRARIKTLNFEP